MEKVLIIKAGYSEFLDKNHSRKVSLGDVLRTTSLLNLYKEDYVTWVTDESAFPLLESNPFIKRLLPYDINTILQLESEEFDSVINLEKIPGICALSDKIRAWKKFGFRFNTSTGEAEAHDRAFEVLAVSSDPNLKQKNEKTAQELLFEMVGKKWNGERYILGYKSKTTEQFDIGLNVKIGQKWPIKSWGDEEWDKLEKELEKLNFKVTRQDKQGSEVLSNLYKYIDWVNSCKLIVSNDSLGMHLAIALNKKILALFGPTPHKEVYFYEQGKAILPEPAPECMPCFKAECEKGKPCILDIRPEKVLEEIKKIQNFY